MQNIKKIVNRLAVRGILIGFGYLAFPARIARWQFLQHQRSLELIWHRNGINIQTFLEILYYFA